MIVHGFITVATPYAAGFGTTATIDLGDADDPDRYTASPVSLAAAATTALTVPGFVTTGPTDLVAEFAGNMVGLSAGEFLVYYTVIAEHRKNEQILAR